MLVVGLEEAPPAAVLGDVGRVAVASEGDAAGERLDEPPERPRLAADLAEPSAGVDVPLREAREHVADCAEVLRVQPTCAPTNVVPGQASTSRARAPIRSSKLGCSGPPNHTRASPSARRCARCPRRAGRRTRLGLPCGSNWQTQVAAALSAATTRGSSGMTRRPDASRTLRPRSFQTFTPRAPTRCAATSCAARASAAAASPDESDSASAVQSRWQKVTKRPGGRRRTGPGCAPDRRPTARRG